MDKKDNNQVLNVDLSVDGEPIGLVPFVETILGETVLAMVQTLHGAENAERIQLTIAKEKRP